MPSRDTFRTSTTSTAASSGSSRISSALDGSRPAIRAPRRPRRIASTSKCAAEVPSDPDRPRQRLLHAPTARSSAGRYTIETRQSNNRRTHMRRPFVSRRSLTIAALAVGLSACNGNNGFNAGAPSVPLSSASLAQAQTQVPLKRTHHHGSSGKIQHVVIIIQENRSFNNLFYGFTGATTADVRLQHARSKDSAQAGRARNELGHRTRFASVSSMRATAPAASPAPTAG